MIPGAGVTVRGKYMTKKDIAKMEQRIKRELMMTIGRQIADESQKIMAALAVAVLAERFGFGDIRIKRFLDNYILLCESIGVGIDSIDKIKENIKDAYGIDVDKFGT